MDRAILNSWHYHNPGAQLIACLQEHNGDTKLGTSLWQLNFDDISYILRQSAVI